MSEAAKKYLVEQYVPQLLKGRSILEESDQCQYVIESCQVLPVTTDGTFMLSLCNRVKVDLREVGNNENVLHLDLVIKVSDIRELHRHPEETERINRWIPFQLSPSEVPPEMYETMVKQLFENEILVYTKVLPQLTHIGYYPK